jgi:hypothetical protein
MITYRLPKRLQQLKHTAFLEVEVKVTSDREDRTTVIFLLRNTTPQTIWVICPLLLDDKAWMIKPSTRLTFRTKALASPATKDSSIRTWLPNHSTNSLNVTCLATIKSNTYSSCKISTSMTTRFMSEKFNLIKWSNRENHNRLINTLDTKCLQLKVCNTASHQACRTCTVARGPWTTTNLQLNRFILGLLITTNTVDNSP